MQKADHRVGHIGTYCAGWNSIKNNAVERKYQNSLIFTCLYANVQISGLTNDRIGTGQARVYL